MNTTKTNGKPVRSATSEYSERQRAADDARRREQLVATTGCAGCGASPGEPCDRFCLSQVDEYPSDK